mmetsp:Transcript_17114/g.60047  ORF Transcript_17114/g.60047 Transcript_17114/m.60047 type:complete len:258 (-) Transcript_17114:1122-1895(-)
MAAAAGACRQRQIGGGGGGGARGRRDGVGAQQLTDDAEQRDAVQGGGVARRGAEQARCLHRGGARRGRAAQPCAAAGLAVRRRHRRRAVLPVCKVPESGRAGVAWPGRRCERWRGRALGLRHVLAARRRRQRRRLAVGHELRAPPRAGGLCDPVLLCGAHMPDDGAGRGVLQGVRADDGRRGGDAGARRGHDGARRAHRPPRRFRGSCERAAPRWPRQVSPLPDRWRGCAGGRVRRRRRARQSGRVGRGVRLSQATA